jgi:hypothetical protein
LEILAVLTGLNALTAEFVAESKLTVFINGRTLHVNTCQEYGVVEYNATQHDLYQATGRHTVDRSFDPNHRNNVKPIILL